MTGFDISTAQGIYLGGNQVQSLYLGGTKLWPAGHDYSQDYLTIERINNAQGFEIEYDIRGTGTLQRSTDGGLNWYNFESTHGRMFFTVSKVLIKGNITPFTGTGFGDPDPGTVTLDLKRYDSDISSVKVYGNPLSIIYGDNFVGQSLSGLDYAFYELFRHNVSSNSCLVDASNLYLDLGISNSCYTWMFMGCENLINTPELPATTLANSCYSGMFGGCYSLTSAPELPATTLADYCYNSMFQSCTSLTTAPSLPATTLAQGCYGSMFKGCTSLVNAPELPATTLVQSCYDRMFSGCTSLTTAPDLPATTLAQVCYQYMFSDCTSLQYIKCLATDISASGSHNYWVYNVSSTGTFIKDANASWSTGVNGIPSGWTVIDAN